MLCLFFSLGDPKFQFFINVISKNLQKCMNYHWLVLSVNVLKVQELCAKTKIISMTVFPMTVTFWYFMALMRRHTETAFDFMSNMRCASINALSNGFLTSFCCLFLKSSRQKKKKNYTYLLSVLLCFQLQFLLQSLRNFSMCWKTRGLFSSLHIQMIYIIGR